jgi:hypothetical protein
LSSDPQKDQGHDLVGAASDSAAGTDLLSQQVGKLQESIDALKNSDSPLKIVSTAIIPAGSLLVAVIALVTGAMMQYQTASMQRTSAAYSTEFAAKHKFYSDLLNELDQYTVAMFEYKDTRFLEYEDKLLADFNAIDPFLDSKTSEGLRRQLLDALHSIGEVNQKASTGNRPNIDVTGKGAYIDKVDPLVRKFRGALRSALFEPLSR